MQYLKSGQLILTFLTLLVLPSMGLKCLKCYNNEGCSDARAPSIDCQEEYGYPTEATEREYCYKITLSTSTTNWHNQLFMFNQLYILI